MPAVVPDQLIEDLVKHLFEGVKLEWTSSSQITLSADAKVGADDGGIVFVTTSDLVFDITVSGLGGLDTGSESPDTWYYAWLLWDPVNEMIGNVLSESPTNPVMPSGYTKKRLVGAVRNDGSSNFLNFTQANKRVYYNADYTVWTTDGNFSQSLDIDISNYAPEGSRSALIQGYAYALATGPAYQARATFDGRVISYSAITPVDSGGYIETYGSAWSYVDNRTRTARLGRDGYRYVTHWIRGYTFDDL